MNDPRSFGFENSDDQSTLKPAAPMPPVRLIYLSIVKWPWMEKNNSNLLGRGSISFRRKSLKSYRNATTRVSSSGRCRLAPC